MQVEMTNSEHKGTIAVLDFGSQYSHLIVRRIRELAVYAELLPPETSAEKLAHYAAIVLSGGPQNLSESYALKADPKLYTLGLPVLGVCYGMQLMAHQLGGKVKAGSKREYGPTEVVVSKSKLFAGLTPKQMTWMSHGDQVTKIPKGFLKIATSRNAPISAMANEAKKMYGLQFHPEVIHTKNGKQILDNFLKICKVSRNWSMKNFVGDSVAKIKGQVGKSKAVCALSGGVDSAIAATMVYRAIGKNLTCIYVDTGLMRSGETENLKRIFKNH